MRPFLSTGAEGDYLLLYTDGLSNLLDDQKFSSKWSTA